MRKEIPKGLSLYYRYMTRRRICSYFGIKRPVSKPLQDLKYIDKKILLASLERQKTFIEEEIERIKNAQGKSRGGLSS